MQTPKAYRGRVQLKCDGTRWRTGREVKGKMANGVGSQYSSHYHGTWCAHLSFQLFDLTEAPAYLNALVRFAKRRNLVSVRVPSHFKRSLQKMWLTEFSWTQRNNFDSEVIPAFKGYTRKFVKNKSQNIWLKKRLPLILRFNFPYPDKHKWQRRVFHLFLCWQRFVVIYVFSLFQCWQWCMELWKRLNATVTVTRHCLSPSNCLRYYNKSCDSEVQKKKYQFKQFLCLGWWEFVHLLLFLLPLLFKILWEFNHQFHHSLETFYSAPYFCRTKKI